MRQPLIDKGGLAGDQTQMARAFLTFLTLEHLRSGRLGFGRGYGAGGDLR